MKLLSTLTLAALAATAFASPVVADNDDPVPAAHGSAACHPDGSWSVTWTVSVPSIGGQWSILPGMYQDPLPWQSDLLPFTFITSGHGDQTAATVGVVYGWNNDGPTGQWVTGSTPNPNCGLLTPEPSDPSTNDDAAAPGEPPTPVHAATAIVEAVLWLGGVRLADGLRIR